MKQVMASELWLCNCT